MVCAVPVCRTGALTAAGAGLIAQPGRNGQHCRRTDRVTTSFNVKSIDCLAFISRFPAPAPGFAVLPTLNFNEKKTSVSVPARKNIGVRSRKWTSLNYLVF
jgi:hypothetical protein